MPEIGGGGGWTVERKWDRVSSSSSLRRAKMAYDSLVAELPLSLASAVTVTDSDDDWMLVDITSNGSDKVTSIARWKKHLQEEWNLLSDLMQANQSSAARAAHYYAVYEKLRSGKVRRFTKHRIRKILTIESPALEEYKRQKLEELNFTSHVTKPLQTSIVPDVVIRDDVMWRKVLYGDVSVDIPIELQLKMRKTDSVEEDLTRFYENNKTAPTSQKKLYSLLKHNELEALKKFTQGGDGTKPNPQLIGSYMAARASEPFNALKARSMGGQNPANSDFQQLIESVPSVEAYLGSAPERRQGDSAATEADRGRLQMQPTTTTAARGIVSNGAPQQGLAASVAYQLPNELKGKVNVTDEFESLMLETAVNTGRIPDDLIVRYNASRQDERHTLRRLLEKPETDASRLLAAYKVLRMGAIWPSFGASTRFNPLFSRPSAVRTQYEQLKRDEFDSLDAFLNKPTDRTREDKEEEEKRAETERPEKRINDMAGEDKVEKTEKQKVENEILDMERTGETEQKERKWKDNVVKEWTMKEKGENKRMKEERIGEERNNEKEQERKYNEVQGLMEKREDLRKIERMRRKQVSSAEKEKMETKKERIKKANKEMKIEKEKKKEEEKEDDKGEEEDARQERSKDRDRDEDGDRVRPRDVSDSKSATSSSADTQPDDEEIARRWAIGAIAIIGVVHILITLLIVNRKKIARACSGKSKEPPNPRDEREQKPLVARKTASVPLAKLSKSTLRQTVSAQN